MANDLGDIAKASVARLHESPEAGAGNHDEPTMIATGPLGEGAEG